MKANTLRFHSPRHTYREHLSCRQYLCRLLCNKWYRQYKKYGVSGLMSSKKQIKRENIDFNAESAPAQDIAELQEQIKQLQMEVDVLKEALNLLKKRPRHQYNGTEKP